MNSQNQQTVGVVTVTYNSATVLPEFLDSLRQQTWDAYTLYAVDNASRDASVALLNAWTGGKVQILAKEENLGVARGNNEGIRAALKDGCEYILLLNNDTAFRPDLIATLVEECEVNSCAMAVPCITYYDRPDLIWCAGGGFDRWQGYGTCHYGANKPLSPRYLSRRRIKYAPTCCMLIHRNVFERIGLMDETYFVYFDDSDFCYRALRNHIVMHYTPQTILAHKVSTLTGGEESSFSTRYLVRNKVYFIRKHFSVPLATMWLIAYGGYLKIRGWLGMDSRERAKIRQQAFREGLLL